MIVDPNDLLCFLLASVRCLLDVVCYHQGHVIACSSWNFVEWFIAISCSFWNFVNWCVTIKDVLLFVPLLFHVATVYYS